MNGEFKKRVYLTFSAIRSCAVSLCIVAVLLWFNASLRAAVVSEATQAALQNAINAGGEVTFGISGTITVSSPLIVSGNVTINGEGKNIIISGGYTQSGTNQSYSGSRVFVINPGARLYLKGVTISSGVSSNGGAVYVSPNSILIASNCVFSGNHAIGKNGANGGNGNNTSSVGGNGGSGQDGESSLGGAIYNEGDTTLIFCSFSQNNAVGGNGGKGGDGGNGDFAGGNGGNGGNGGSAKGGAIYNIGVLDILNSTFHDNTTIAGAGGAGGTNGVGAIYGRSGNGGKGGDAGGAAIFNIGLLKITGSTLYNNSSSGAPSAKAGIGSSGNGNDGLAGGNGYGGAIANFGTNIALNCTFYENLAQGGAGGDGGDSHDFLAGDGGNGGSAVGGSLFNSGFSGITNCTFASGNVIGGTNGVAGQGTFSGKSGGIGFAGGGNIANQGLLHIQNTIVTSPKNGSNIWGGITDFGYNISSDTTGFYHAKSFLATDPKLGTFGDNGGLTYTIPPLVNSLAIDNGYQGLGLTNDQRGVARGYGDTIDIGACEVQLTRIRGKITDGSNGVSGVKVSAGSNYSITDSNGNYVISNLVAGSYLVVPEATNLLFSPASQTVTVGISTVSNVNFTVLRLYKIEGRITENGTGLSGVTITANSYSTTSDINGYYIFTNLPSGNYTITPYKENYIFTPPSTSIVLNSDITNVNFSASLTNFTISGVVLEGNEGISGVKISIGNDVVYTDSFGRFALSNLSTKSYIIIPSKDGYVFTPPVLSVNLTNNVTNIVFTSKGIYTIYGTILRNGLPVSGVRVSAGIYSGVTDNAGNYKIESVSPKTHKIIPFKEGFNFDPPSYDINVTRDIFSLNYIALKSISITGYVFNISPLTGNTNGVITNVLISATNYYNGMSGSNSLTLNTISSGDGSFVFTNLNEGVVLITPAHNRVKFTPAQTNIVITNDSILVYFLGSQLYDVSGYVKYNGVGLANVKIDAGFTSVNTDVNGYFSINRVEGTNLTLTPSLDGYRFEPGSLSLVPDERTTNLLFTAYGNLSINGSVMRNNIGIESVNIIINDTLINTGNDGRFSLQNLAPGNYNVIPYLPGYIFVPPSISTNLSSDSVIINFAALKTYNVSGRVTYANAGIANATVTCGISSATTDDNGYYTLINVPEGTNIITVTHPNYRFAPLNVLVESNLLDVNFVATPMYSISGRILEGARGVAGAMVSAGGVSTFSSSTGDYILENIPGGEVTVVVEKEGYRFVPPSVKINLTSNINNLNFSAIGTLFVSGQVTDGNAGIPGIRITAYGIQTTTDSNGYYIISNLPPRSITVMPASDEYVFSPSSVNVSLTPPGVSDVNFIAIKFTGIFGQIFKDGQPLDNVKVSCSDGRITYTDSNGKYGFDNLQAGTYTVTPELKGHQFEPPYAEVALPSAATNINFNAYELKMYISMTNNVLYINTYGKPLGNYYFQASDSVTSGTWTTIAPFQTDTNGFIQLIIPTIDKTRPRFYRFRSQ